MFKQIHFIDGITNYLGRQSDLQTSHVDVQQSDVQRKFKGLSKIHFRANYFHEKNSIVSKGSRSGR